MNLEKFLFYLRLGNWIRIRKEDKELSRLINDILDNPDTIIRIKNEYVAVIGGLYVRISNFPYSYGYVTDQFYELI
jgi:hydrogenase maturation factor HypE